MSRPRPIVWWEVDDDGNALAHVLRDYSSDYPEARTWCGLATDDHSSTAGHGHLMFLGRLSSDDLCNKCAGLWRLRGFFDDGQVRA